MACVDRPTRHLVRRHRVAIEKKSPPAATRAREPGPPGRLLRSAGLATVNLAPPFAAPFLFPNGAIFGWGRRCRRLWFQSASTTVAHRDRTYARLSARPSDAITTSNERDIAIAGFRLRYARILPCIRCSRTVDSTSRRRLQHAVASSAPAGSGPWRWAGPPARMQGRRTHVWRAGAPTALQVQSQPCAYGRSGSMRAVIGRPRRHRAAQLHGAAAHWVRRAFLLGLVPRRPQAKKRGWGASAERRLHGQTGACARQL